MNKLVSAIITTHNRRDLLIRAVKSVLNQTYKDIELIVVDDASDERADKVLKGFDLQYIYIPKEESKGGNHARNTGILAAKGEYVAFLDDDDYWLPMKIEEQIAIAEEKKCELVYCPKTSEIITKDSTIIYAHASPNPTMTGDLRKKILYNICTTTSCILVKKRALVEVGMFDENLKFWQEYELTIRLAQRTPFFYAWKDLVVYRVNTSDQSRLTNKYLEWRNAVKYIYDKHTNLYRNLSIREKIYVKRLYWKDARLRCDNSDLHYLSIYYRILIKISYFPERIKRLFSL